jgi:hypothetical protein
MFTIPMLLLITVLLLFCLSLLSWKRTQEFSSHTQ